MAITDIGVGIRDAKSMTNPTCKLKTALENVGTKTEKSLITMLFVKIFKPSLPDKYICFKTVASDMNITWEIFKVKSSTSCVSIILRTI